MNKKEAIEYLNDPIDYGIGKMPEEVLKAHEEAVTLAITALEQPEIIRCKDCKHYKAYEYTGKLACHYVIGGTVEKKPDDFCSRAERITDE